jgi:predicted RNA-binding protein YlqC (UPF0109 family)
MTEIKNLLYTIVTSIVDNVDSVRIDEEQDSKGLSYKVSVAAEDVGRLIGVKGRIASSIRNICKAAGAKNKVRVLINVDKEPLA